MKSYKKLARHSVYFNLSIATLADFLRSRIDFETVESKFSSKIGVKYSVFVPSCRWAVMAGVLGSSLIKKKVVIIPAYGFYALSALFRELGFDIVLADCGTNHCSIDLKGIGNISEVRGGVLLITHSYGIPCNMDEIIQFVKQNQMVLIEDCAHALGSSYKNKTLGSFGDFSCFSFGIGKLVNGGGAGMFCTNCEELYREVLQKRNSLLPTPDFEFLINLIKIKIISILTQGRVFSFLTFPLIRLMSLIDINILDKWLNEYAPPSEAFEKITKSRKPTRLSAFIVDRELDSIDALIKKIKTNSKYLMSKIPDAYTYSSFHDENVCPSYLIIKSKRRNELRRALLKSGIDTKNDDLTFIPEYLKLEDGSILFPNSYRASSSNLEIPCDRELKDCDLKKIVDGLVSFGDGRYAN